ncbi:helix-turn-helix transcriptional regulator [bacterium]|nr:helix-turn-helix transcriptional regulator [bacterium]MCB1219269.1 helix-turn-helix transcriptional regulator [bacterium]UNM09516.1 MAG: helix-turn-helix transcriptional regulator [Planctomycetales bacterium]
MKLRQWRLCAEMTQQQLANRAKVARASIAHLENGYYPPSPTMAGRICEALGSELGMELQPHEVFEQTREDGRGRMKYQPRRRS